MIKNHSRKDTTTGAVVNEEPMTTGKPTTGTKPGNKPVTYLMCYPEGLRAILPSQPSADYFKESQELLAKALTTLRLFQ